MKKLESEQNYWKPGKKRDGICEANSDSVFKLLLDINNKHDCIHGLPNYVSTKQKEKTSDLIKLNVFKRIVLYDVI